MPWLKAAARRGAGMGSAEAITLSFELFFVRKQAETEREWLPHLSRSDRKAMGCAINKPPRVSPSEPPYSHA